MTDQMKLRNTLLEKRNALLTADNPEYITSGIFRPSLFSQRGEINVKTASKQEIVEAYKGIIIHELVSKELNSDTNYLGYSIQDWKADFKTRISVLDRTNTLAEIDAIEVELRRLLTPKELRTIGVADLASRVESL